MVTSSPKGWPTKAKEAPFPHEVRLAIEDTNPVFQCINIKIPKNAAKWPDIYVVTR